MVNVGGREFSAWSLAPRLAVSCPAALANPAPGYTSDVAIALRPHETLMTAHDG